jgi:hypothetical protein
MPPTRWLNKVHETVRRLLFHDSRVKQDEMPTIFKHFVATSRNFAEENIVAKFLVLTSAAVSFSRDPGLRTARLTQPQEHTMSSAMTQALFDLCTMPDLVDILRAEAEQALKRNGGKWSMSVVKQLVRLDSFLKESQRMNPPNFCKFLICLGR